MRVSILAVFCLGFSLIVQAQVLDADALQAQLAQLGLADPSLDGIGGVSQPVQCNNDVELAMLKMQLQQAQGIITRLYSVIQTYQDKTNSLTQLVQSQQTTVLSYESQIQNLTASRDQCYGDLSACNNGTMLLTDQLDEANQLNSNLSRRLSQAEGERNICEKTLQQVVVQRDDLSRSQIACLDNLSGCITALDNCTSEHQDVKQIHAAVSNQLRNCTLENQHLGEVVANLTGEVASTENELHECSQNSTLCSMEHGVCLRSVDQCKIDKDNCNDELIEKVRELGVLGQEQADCNSTLAQKIKDLDDTEQELKKCQNEKFEALMKTSKKSCQQWHELNVPSGEYMVDPDGENKGVAPFKVMCDFDKTPIETKVVRGPMKLETEVKGSYENRCWYASNYGVAYPSSESDGDDDKAKRSSELSPADRGSKICVQDTIAYGVEREQLAALTAVATSCKQVVSWTCANQDELVIFTNSGEKVNKKHKWFGIFSKQTEWKHYFLDFSNESQAECDCAGSCVADSRLACNCYANKSDSFTDTITMTNKNDLPVMRVGLGDLNREAETGMVSVGDLVCV